MAKVENAGAVTDIRRAHSSRNRSLAADSSSINVHNRGSPISSPAASRNPLTPISVASSQLTKSSRGYTFRRQLNGTTDVDVVIVREGKNFKGRVFSGLLGTVAMRSLRKAFVHSVKAIESRSNASVVEPS